jgi:hypothetical protein
MTPEELQARLAAGIPAPVPPTKPSPTLHVGELLGPTLEHCLVHARKFKLIDDQGQVWCIHDGGPNAATMPTLECAEHVAWRRK